MTWFSGLYGNRETVNRLSALIARDTLPHAFLLLGEDRSGRHTLAYEISAALNCDCRGDGKTDLPCRRCNNCRRILQNKFTDVKTLGKSGGKATIGVDEVRLFREDVFLSPTESRYKIYLIENAECLTPQAQNALLKVIEEPPAGVIFFLMANSADKILTTVKSRVQTVLLERFSTEELDRCLSDKDGFSDLKAKNPARYRALLLCADGSIGQAKDLLADGRMEEEERLRADVVSLISGMNGKKQFAELYAAVGSLPDKRAEFTEIAEKILLALRDLTVLKKESRAPMLFFTDRETAMSLSEGFTLYRLQKLFDIFGKALSDCLKNANMTLLPATILAGIKSV